MDLNNVQFLVQKVMRYDTPGDWTVDENGLTISAWEGLGKLAAQAVQLHEFVEAVVLLAAGITPEEIDILDDYRIKSRLFARGDSRATS